MERRIILELEEVLPNLVTEIHHPEQTDVDGNVIAEAVDFKGVNYEELIPIILQATKEQQAIIEQQQEQIDALVAAVNACFDWDLKSMELENDIQMDPVKTDTLNQNAPNPFMEMTTISYSLAQDALATVKIYNSHGQLIDTLLSETQSEGNHSIQWNANGMAAGIYFYSLEIDSVEQVRRMVKL
ncbi:MAG: hypothetical protein ACI84C_002976 [Flavobacteriales bacterium]|jgi:hypothetical protein